MGAAKLARETGLSVSDAKKLIEAYWQRNWSVRKLSDSLRTKKIDGETWLFNPVSRFWYSLRSEKDRFSTLNQGTGVYCFDTWIETFLMKRPQLTGQFHDEVILEIKKGNREKCVKLLKNAIKHVNEKLQLNITAGS